MGSPALGWGRLGVPGFQLSRLAGCFCELGFLFYILDALCLIPLDPEGMAWEPTATSGRSRSQPSENCLLEAIVIFSPWETMMHLTFFRACLHTSRTA